MHTNKYKYVSIVSAVAVLLLLGIYMWMTYRSVSRDIAERAGNQLMWAMFYESYTRADLVTAEDTLSLPQSRGNRAGNTTQNYRSTMWQCMSTRC